MLQHNAPNPRVIGKSGFVDDDFADAAPVPIGNYDGGRALILSADTNIKAAEIDFQALDLIVIPFGNSADGRGFSLAADLRAMGYRGHLRAAGHILVDQFRAALLCGFDDVEISNDQSLRNPEHQWRAVPLGTTG